VTEQPIVELREVSKIYTVNDTEFEALNRLTLSLNPRQFIAILGKSGSGKSTLLNLIAGLDRPTTGTLQINGQPLKDFSEDDLARWRGKQVGIVFQFFQLLPTLTVLENLLIAMDFRNIIPREQRQSLAFDLLETVEIADQAHKLPATLSGGQQQRAAIARALVNNPDLIVADEPTGNLDTATSDAVLNVFQRLVERGKTLIIVTHDEDLARHADTIVTLSDGKLQDIQHNQKLQVGGVS